MKEILCEANETIHQARLSLLKICLIMASLCSLISLAFQQRNLVLLPLLIIFALNLFFQAGLNLLMLQALHDQPIKIKNLLQLQPYLKKLLPLFILYGILLGLGVAVFLGLSRIKEILIFLPMLIFILVVLLNVVNHLTLFGIMQEKLPLSKSLKNAWHLFLKSRKLFMHILMKTLLFILVGSLLVYALNVFVYAPQIDATLKSAAIIDETLVQPYFSTNLSYMIQSVGMQLVVSYIMIVSGITYGVYYLKMKH
mgnify:FL=1